MDSSFEAVVIRIGQQVKNKILPVSFPSWYQRYKELFLLENLEEKNVSRKDWSSYVSQRISKAQKRLIFHLDWPFVSQDLRNDVLRVLQNVLVQGVQSYSYFRAESTIPAHSLHIPISFSNKTVHVQVEEAHNSEKNSLSFAIIDNDVLFEEPAQAYHSYRKFYYAPFVPDSKLKQIFTEYAWYFS